MPHGRPGQWNNVMRIPLRPFAVACLGLFGAALLASGCSNSDRPQAGMDRHSGATASTPASRRVIASGQPVPKGGGSYKVGDPYQIEGQWHTPREDPNYDRTGVASYYAHDFHGRGRVIVRRPTGDVRCQEYVRQIAQRMRSDQGLLFIRI